jgi:hypothetical protein
MDGLGLGAAEGRRLGLAVGTGEIVVGGDVGLAVGGGVGY